MRSGNKNAVVSIFRNVEGSVDPDYNTPVYAPTLWRENIFCVATPRRGRELVDQGQIVAETYMKFDFEYFDVVGIDETMFIECEGVAYDIKGILADLTNKDFISIDAVTRPAGNERGT